MIIWLLIGCAAGWVLHIVVSDWLRAWRIIREVPTPRVAVWMPQADDGGFCADGLSDALRRMSEVRPHLETPARPDQ